MSEPVDPTVSTEQEASETAWQEVGFAAAPAGWYAVFVERDHPEFADAGWRAVAGARHNMPIAGWLTLEDERTHSRRFVAAIPTPQGVLVPVDSFGTAMLPVAIHGPGDVTRDE